MASPLNSEDIDRIARKRAGAKLGWYAHLAVYLVVNTTLFMASALELRHREWSFVPAMGWGLGLLLHGVAVFVLGSGSGLRERMVQKERERLQREQGR